MVELIRSLLSEVEAVARDSDARIKELEGLLVEIVECQKGPRNLEIAVMQRVSGVVDEITGKKK